jgi:hypothetical protein
MCFGAVAVLLREFVGTFFITLTHALTMGNSDMAPIAIGAMYTVQSVP